jgi:hypothetical protein
MRDRPSGNAGSAGRRAARSLGHARSCGGCYRFTLITPAITSFVIYVLFRFAAEAWMLADRKARVTESENCVHGSVLVRAVSRESRLDKYLRRNPVAEVLRP